MSNPIKNQRLRAHLDAALEIPPGTAYRLRSLGGSQFTLSRAQAIVIEMGRIRSALQKSGAPGAFALSALSFSAYPDWAGVESFALHWTKEDHPDLPPNPMIDGRGPTGYGSAASRNKYGTSSSACWIELSRSTLPKIRIGSATAPAPNFREAWAALSQVLPAFVEITNAYSRGDSDVEIIGENVESFENF